MKQLQQTTRFEKDLARMKRRGADVGKLKQVVLPLLKGEPLPIKYRDHPLSGNWRSHRECHLAPDWLLIYRSTLDFVRLERTGTHADLFGK
ncbi:MAG: type II toxin-antitoxin system YafQ family toxin [Lentisphaerae bacterium]|nr:type II toxin-antitoxin system YafQ family toxin [Lentisphaerota bacterium]